MREDVHSRLQIIFILKVNSCLYIFQGGASPSSKEKELVVLRTWNAESIHNYENNQHVTQIFTCPGAELFQLEFDPLCNTERR